MSFPALHRPHSIVLPDPLGGGNSVIVTQFQSFAVNRQWSIFRQKTSSAAGPQFSGVDEADPECQFETLDLYAMLNLFSSGVGQQGLVVGYDPVINTGTVSAYYRKGKKRGLREAVVTAVHDRFDMVNNAMLFWRTLQAQRGKNNRAQLGVTLKVISNDGDNPLVHVGSSACVGTEGVTYVYGLGPVKVGSTFLNSLDSIRIDNQVQSQSQGTNGLAFAQYAEIDDVNPMATFETADASIMGTYQSPAAITTLTVFLRRLQKNGLPYADASAVHIKLQATAGTLVASESTGNPGKFTLQAAVDKPNDATGPWTIDTAAQIA